MFTELDTTSGPGLRKFRYGPKLNDLRFEATRFPSKMKRTKVPCRSRYRSRYLAQPPSQHIYREFRLGISRYQGTARWVQCRTVRKLSDRPNLTKRQCAKVKACKFYLLQCAMQVPYAYSTIQCAPARPTGTVHNKNVKI